MKKRFLAMSLVLAMLLTVLCACGSSTTTQAADTDTATTTTEATTETETESESTAEPEYTWSFSCANTADHPAVVGVMHFADLVNEKSNGRLQINVFHSAQLANDRDCIEGMQMNTIQGGMMVSSSLANFTNTFLVFDLPFLFENSEQGQTLCDSEVGQEILGTLEDIGVKGLGFMNYGMRNITNSKHPIETPEDLKGIKIRTMENPIHMAAFSAMGADPTPMAFGEVFTALQQGTIDAQENPLSVITSSKFEEVQDYLSITEHVYSAAPLMVSKAAYDALPEDLQAVVDECGAEACVWQREYLAEQEKTWLADLEAAGCQINYPDKAAFVEATQSVYDKYVGDGQDQVSPDMLAKVREVIGNA